MLNNDLVFLKKKIIIIFLVGKFYHLYMHKIIHNHKNYAHFHVYFPVT